MKIFIRGKKGENVKKIAKNFLETQPESRLYAGDKKVITKKAEGMKKFIVATPKEMFDYINSQNPEERCFYEFWQLRHSCLMLNIKDENNTSIDKYEIIAKIKQDIINLFKEKYSVTLSEKILLVQDNSTDKLIDIYFKCKKIRFENVAKQRKFWSLNLKKISYNINTNIYYYDYPLQIIYCYKFFIDTDGTHKSTPVNGDKFDYENFLKYSITDFENEGHIFNVPNIKVEKTEKEKQQGKIYIMHNPMFKYYGDNVYKVGRAINVHQRMKCYTTPYIENSEIIYKSNLFDNYALAESYLFNKLDYYRITSNREFFKCDKDIIIDEIKRIEEKFKDNSIYDLEYKKIKKTYKIGQIMTNEIDKIKYIKLLVKYLNFDDKEIIKKNTFREYKGGKHGNKPTKEIINFFSENYKLLRDIYGDKGRCYTKNNVFSSEVCIVNYLMRIVNFVFNKEIIKKKTKYSSTHRIYLYYKGEDIDGEYKLLWNIISC